jgi:hypothetical protein
MATDNNRAEPLATAANPAASSTGPKFRVHIGERDCQFTVGRAWAELVLETSTAHTLLTKAALVTVCEGKTSKTINFEVRHEVRGGLEVVGFINYYKDHGLTQRNKDRKGSEVAAKVHAELKLLELADVTEAASTVDREAALAALLG